MKFAGIFYRDLLNNDLLWLNLYKGIVVVNVGCCIIYCCLF